MLFLLQPGANSRSIFLDMIRGFEAAGHQPVVTELAPIWEACGPNATDRLAAMTAATQEIAALVRRERIDAAACMWGTALTTFMNTAINGQPRTVFDTLRVPLLCYWLDAPHWAQGGSMLAALGSPLLAAPSLVHAVNNRATAGEMRAVLGFGRTLPLAYGVDPVVFSPAGTEPEFDLVAAVGPGDPAPTPEALALLDHDNPPLTALRAREAERVGGKFPKLLAGRDDGPRLRPLFHALLAAQLEDRHEPMLARIGRFGQRDEESGRAAAALLAEPVLFVRATMLIREVERTERAFTLAWLSRRFSMATFGSGDLAAWGSRAVHLGELPYRGMAAAYSRGRIGINVMRWQDDSGVNLKPFEIAASGRPCISVRRSGAESLFAPGSEIAFFDGPAHAAELARSLILSGAAEMGGAARSRVLAEHTWAHRAATMTEELASARASMPDV